jgi:murein DD-endopeptidase MepM/ murein hydrolase activator NlpD
VIPRGFRATVLVIPLVCGVQIVGARSQGQRPLQVSFTPAIAQPGDVVRIDVDGLSSDAQLTATMFERHVPFHFDAMQQTWQTLIGIDLETKPGTYQLQIQRAASSTQTTRTLKIAPKQFRVRRLRVAEGFVDPPAEVLAQIVQDRAVLADAYARESPKRWSGAFLLPVDGKPTSNFGTRTYYNGQQRAPHAGVDFAGEPGTPVRAANHGEVIVAAPMYFTGNTIVVDYGDRLFSVFAHLSELHAKPGDIVEPSTIVGLVGATGRVTGPHLHWSVRLNGARVDPLSLIAATRHTVNGKR